MLLLALVFVVAGFALYVLVPALLIHSTYPLPVYALLLTAVGAAVASKRRGLLRTLTIGVTSLVAILFFAYTLVLSNLPRGQLAVHPGDRFPDFTLLTSTRESFSPSQLTGQSAALYVFYRGDW
jgi:hypothetical protein